MFKKKIINFLLQIFSKMDNELSRPLTRTEILNFDKLRLRWKELSVEVQNKPAYKNSLTLNLSMFFERTLYWMDCT